jgi:hypothetical protein
MLSIAEDDTAPGGLSVDISGACNMSLEQVGEFGAALAAAREAVERSRATA